MPRLPAPLHGRALLLAGTVLAGVLASSAAHAQSAAAIRAAAGIPAGGAAAGAGGAAAATAPAGANIDPLRLLRDQSSAQARALATQQRMMQKSSLAVQAQQAARTAAEQVTPTFNGLGVGALKPIDMGLKAVQDATGKRTWQGAKDPTQVISTRIDPTDPAKKREIPAYIVTVEQTEERAVLSWETLNVGRDTTLQFIQRENGVVQADWIALNRVVGRYDPMIGTFSNPEVSRIAGQVTSDATVLFLNRAGVIFSGSSQLNTRSLFVSTLEVGRAQINQAGVVRPLTLKERNDEFLRQGLLGPADQADASQPVPFTFSAEYDEDLNVIKPEVEGDILIEGGARIAAGDTGTLFFVAPNVTNQGTLSATDGQVSLQSARLLRLTRATGTGSGATSFVRGLVVAASGEAPGGTVTNSANGIITSTRGYASLGAGSDGSVTNQGLIAATTSVSRNGFVDLFAGKVALASSGGTTGGTIAITPDDNGETIPQAPASVAAFKTSQVRITGSSAGQSDAPSNVTLAGTALVYAPSANVLIGSPAGNGVADTSLPDNVSSVTISSGATIDVGGIKDLELPSSRNSIQIGPLKRNELRDTPLYRETGSFLNGATVFVDPRRSGVRADGTRWVGSPLIEAESFYQQVGVTAAELMTRGGAVAVGTASFSEFGASGARRDPALAPSIVIGQNATIDISGGWVRYAAGEVQTSQLITANGEVVDIGDADPNALYVGLVNPFSTTVTRFGVTDSFPNYLLQGVRTSPSYTEGRDAGALTLSSSVVALDGTVHADAFAGENQRGEGSAGTGTSAIDGDQRSIQSTPFELPAGGMLFVRSLAESNPVVGGGNARITQTVTPLAGGVLTNERRAELLFSADALTAMGLGQFSVWTSGGLSVEAGTVTRLLPGGIFEANTGRAITIDGAISTPGGRISLATFTLGASPIYDGTDSGGGSVFADDPAQARSFDVVVNGTLSARGRYVNDFGQSPSTAEGPGYTSGGAIEIAVAPSVTTSAGAAPDTVRDISGSILIETGATVDLAGGFHIEPDGEFDTSARGGDLSLFNQTIYFQLQNDYISAPPPLGRRGFRATLPESVVPANRILALNPDRIRATISVADGTVQGHGFGGGGAFSLTTPAFAFGPQTGTETRLPIDFIGGSGFAEYRIDAYRTAIVENRFVNDFGGTNALLQVNTVRVQAGETLDLTQRQFSPDVTTEEALALRGAATGSDIYSLLTPVIPDAPFDRRGVALALGGTGELVIDAGGSLVGAAGSSITAPRFLNAGNLRLPGGTIAQTQTLPGIYDDANPASAAIGVRDLSEVFTIRPGGDIVETDPNSAGIRSLSGAILTNSELAFERTIYLIGEVSQREGISLAPGSITDLSGASLVNPRAVTAGGIPIYDGRLIDGGTIVTASRNQTADAFVTIPAFGTSLINDFTAGGAILPGRIINIQPDASVDISGAADSYVRLTANGTYLPTRQWSDAGRIELANGGQVAGADIAAKGGDPLARGGTFVALNPLLRQTDDGTPADNLLPADLLMGAGFDSLLIRGSLGFEGDVTLALGRSLQLTSALFDGSTVAAQAYIVRIGGTGSLLVDAPIIRFDSIAQTVPNIAFGTPGTATATFRAQAIGIEGAVLFDRSLASTQLEAAGNIRLIGTAQIEQSLGITGVPITPSLIGQLQATGDLTLAAGQVHPTTGTSFTVAASGEDSTIRIEKSAAPTPSTPYAAGANLTIQAAVIEQAGVLRAPLSTLTLGGNTPLVIGGVTVAPSTTTLTLLPGSITSVSANGLSIPYGTTTDQIEYFFAPTSSQALTAAPAALLNLGGNALDLQAGSTVDISGGGEVYAYEFVPGVGGSRDLLDRLNPDDFSGNDGLLYPDGRQVFAIVPGLDSGALALYDPIYSADYADLYAAGAGRRVYLDAAPGLAAGWYTLLPARYALLPGGLRVVEQPEYGAGVIGTGQTLLDGSRIAAGYYGIAGTDQRESEVRNFIVQTQDVFRQFSNITVTDATPTFANRATRNGLTPPRAPVDAGRLVLQPILSLAAEANFLTAPAEGGRSSTADIAGQSFLIFGADAPVAPPAGTILIGSETLNNLNVASLFIGGTRTDNADGTTSLAITGRSILIENSADTALIAPEILLAVDGSGSTIRLADGATVLAQGTITDPRSGAYLIDGASPGMTGAGALFRASAGVQRAVERRGVEAVASAPALDIGLARIRAASLQLDTTGNLAIASPVGGAADIVADDIALGARGFAFTDAPYAGGLAITSGLLPVLTNADRLTLTSVTPILFSEGSYALGDLTLDTPGIALTGPAGGAVAITAGDVRLLSTAATPGVPCTGAGCGTGTFALTADALSVGSGLVALTGFGGGVAISAAAGTSYDGRGTLNAGSGPVTLTTPFVADRAMALDPSEEALLPSLALVSEGSVAINRDGFAAATPGEGTPGARLTVTGSSITVTDATLRATAGAVSLNASGDVIVGGTARIAAPSYARTFGDSADPVSVSAPGGVVRIASSGGDVEIGALASLSVGGASGRSGAIDIAAGAGEARLLGTLDAASPGGGGGFRLVTGGAFDLASFSSTNFTDIIRIDAGTGDLVLASGRTLAARDVALNARTGAVTIGGTINASGVEGGDIALYGATGVTLDSTGRIVATASGYSASDSRQAEGGDVTLGTVVGGAITLAAGSSIDVSALRPGDRLVADVRNSVTFYRLAEGDRGGTVSVRAPIIELPGADSVNVTAAGTVTGAREVSVEAYKRFDLASVAAGGFTGVTISGATATLDTRTAGNNFLAAYAPGTIPAFVQDFDLAGASGLGGLEATGVLVTRPGVELSYSGDIVLASNWNLGAGEVDVARALADGVMQVRRGAPGLTFVPVGNEGLLLADYTRFTYRVGGSADGEAGVLNIRAGGDLTLRGSVTDGFFAFRDQTTPEAIAFALGGGTRIYNPVLQPTCMGGCESASPFDPLAAPTNPITFSFNNPGSGGGGVRSQDNLLDVPYSAAANLPSALGAGAGGIGDPLGTAEVFATLPSGETPESWSYRLVGGAASSGADPLAIEPGSTGNVTIAGETTYPARALTRTQTYEGALLTQAGTDARAGVISADEFLDAFIAANAGDPAVDDDGVTKHSSVLITLNTPRAALTTFLRAQAGAFFGGFPGEANLTGSPAAPTAVVTSLALASQFFASIDESYGALVSANPTAYNPGVFRPVSPGTNQIVRTRVRTGTGDIAVAAAGSLETVGTPTSSDARYQAGSSAIYTAGVRASLAPKVVADSAGVLRTVDPSAYARTAVNAAIAAPLANALVQTPLYLDDGGDVSLTAGSDILGRRDVVGGLRLNQAVTSDYIGPGDQPFRVGSVTATTDLRANPQLFQTGIGTLGGGDIDITAGGTLRDLTVVANTSVVTADVTGGGVPQTRALWTAGGGDTRLEAGGNITSGMFDVGSGTLEASANGAVNSTGSVTVRVANAPVSQSNAVRIRVADATASVEAGDTLTIRGIAGYAATITENAFEGGNNARGFYTPIAGVNLLGNGRVTMENAGSDVLAPQSTAALQIAALPGSFGAASLTGDLVLAPATAQTDYQLFMLPSPTGQLNLYAGANLRPVTINMEDGDPGILPGYFSIYSQPVIASISAGRNYAWPAIFSNTSDALRRTYHNENITHAGDSQPVRIAAGGDIEDLTVNLPKQARISAGRDIVNAFFVGQNLDAGDITRVVAGRDIIATSRVAATIVAGTSTPLPVAEGNNFIIGGPGAFFLEAGRDAGPFLNSAVSGGRTYGGGVLSVGNEYNPWLEAAGAEISVLFGVAPGVNFSGFRDYYVDPANVENLPDDLFVQNVDEFDRFVPDRTQPIYGAILIDWMQANYAAALNAAYGTTDVTSDQAYAVFLALPELNQRGFLLKEVYFNELVQTSLPDTVSFGKASRSYRAVESLFPSDWGYTANNFSPDPDTPVDGELGSRNPIETGNLDLRLATIQTARGGPINILGPGGRVLGGSTVSTAAQAERRGFFGEQLTLGRRVTNEITGQPLNAVPITSIPTGFEGVITLRGGEVNGFVDGDFLLNQSRLFTQAGGDIVLFSSNGDLNAGQGRRTSANFPPVAVRIGPNANSEIDAVGGVAGAGIAAFQPGPGIEAPSVFLVAPTGTVDAGDAGVRVSGNLFVAALSVANADNFSVGGSAFGVPSGPVVNVSGNTAAAASSAAAAAAAQQVSSNSARRREDPLSRIIVNVLGYMGSAEDDPCERNPRPANCPAR